MRRANLIEEAATTRTIDSVYRQREGKLEAAHPLHSSRSSRMLETMQLSRSRSRSSLRLAGTDAPAVSLAGVGDEDDFLESPGHARSHHGRGLGDAGPWSLSASTSLPFSPVAARWVQRPHDGGSSRNGSRSSTPDAGIGRLRAFESRPSSATALAAIGIVGGAGPYSIYSGGVARPLSSSSSSRSTSQQLAGVGEPFRRDGRGPFRRRTFR